MGNMLCRIDQSNFCQLHKILHDFHLMNRCDFSNFSQIARSQSIAAVIISVQFMKCTAFCQIKLTSNVIIIIAFNFFRMNISFQLYFYCAFILATCKLHTFSSAFIFANFSIFKIILIQLILCLFVFFLRNFLFWHYLNCHCCCCYKFLIFLCPLPPLKPNALFLRCVSIANCSFIFVYFKRFAIFVESCDKIGKIDNCNMCLSSTWNAIQILFHIKQSRTEYRWIIIDARAINSQSNDPNKLSRVEFCLIKKL